MAHVVDCFECTVNGARKEVVIGVDALGEIKVSTEPSHPALSPVARTELSVHQLLMPPRSRAIEASELYVLDLEVVEQLADTPGRNDPLFLYGTLFGVSTSPHRSANGQLMLTRADLLHGFVAARPWAFRYANQSCFHALIPAGSDDDVRAGEAVVLAYSLPPPEAWDGVPANDGFVRHLLGDVLSAMKEDLEREERGRGLLARLFTQPHAKQLELSPSLDTDGYFDIASRALGLFDAWPAPRTLELQRRAKAAVMQRVSAPIAQPFNSVNVTAPTPQRPSSDWVQDFLQQHRKPGVTPHVTSPKSRPDWMKDFE